MGSAYNKGRSPTPPPPPLQLLRACQIQMPRFAAQLSAYCHRLWDHSRRLLIRQHLHLVRCFRNYRVSGLLLAPTHIHTHQLHLVSFRLFCNCGRTALERTYARTHASANGRIESVIGTTTPKPDKPTFHVTRTPLLRDFLLSDSPCFVLSRARADYCPRHEK
jgi:hypothetical protein